jgi:hypothetical protein
MTKLVSGRILKTPSANVSAERYQFLEISEAEPDLGVPPANNYVFTSDPEGNRQWVDLTTTLGNSDVAIGNVYAAGTFYGNGLIVRNIDILDALIGDTTLANVVLARELYAANVVTDRIAANVWEGIYTANVIESPEYLYYTNDRVFSNIQLASVGDLADVTIANIDVGQALVWDGNIFIPVFVNSEVANVADLSLRVLSIENFTTANVKEASSNLYFTNTRVLDALVEANVIVNDLFVSGDLVVQGNSAVLNVSTLIVEDKNIVIANGAASASIADGAGITIEGANATILYKESGDKFELNKNLDVLGNITAGVGTGGSITGANIISGETLVADLLQVDTVVSNTIVNTENITAETIFANVVANTIVTDSVTTPIVISDSDLVLTAGGQRTSFNTAGDLKLPGYLEFKSNTFVGDEPGAGLPAFRVVSAPGLAIELTSGGSISGNNNVATFDVSGEFAVPKSLRADSLVSNTVSSISIVANTTTTTTLVPNVIRFNTSAGIEVSEGEMAWNSSDGTLDIGLQYGDVVLQVGQETHYAVRNNTGETIENGTAVYCDGVTGGSGRIQANLMIGDGSIDPVQFLGLATHDITSGINGVVTYFGYVRGLDTRGTANTALSVGDENWEVGDKLYVHPTALGKLTKIEPEAPNTKICVAVVISRHQSVGTLFVRPTTNLKLTKLSDVQIANVESNQFLVYDNNRWENITVDTDNILEGSNLYYTNARVLANVSEMSINVLADVDITGILPGQIISWDGDKFVPGSADIALFSERSNSAVVANTVLSLEGLTTDDLAEGANLYFSNARARQAFSAGRGIIIQENGVIKSVDDSDLYNLDLNGSVIQNVTDVMAPILAIPTAPVSASYVVQSLHITNISEETAHLSANVVFASNSTVTLFDKLALPIGSSLELFDKSLALRPGDTLNVQSFNQSEVATSNVISAFLVYESVFEDISFVNAGIDIGNPDSNVLLYDSNLSYTILESIKISNLEDVDVPVRVYITDANTNIKGYLTHKLPVPSNSVVDILKKPKRLERNDRLYINYTGVANTNAVSAFMSGRIGAYYILDVNPGEIVPGTDSVVGFETTAAEGTQLYYTIRPA